MKRLERIQTLPKNIDDFIDEIGLNMQKLYGPLARKDYLQRAKRGIAANISHPGINTYGIIESGNAHALLFGIVRNGVGEIAFIHVLSKSKGKGYESRLLDEAVKDFRKAGIGGIVCETILNSGLVLHDSLAPLGFRHFSRELMHCSLHKNGPLPSASHRPRPLTPGDWKPAAQCIVSAYQNHPGRFLHSEVQVERRALDFISRVQAGNYGQVRAAYSQCLYHDAVCVGVILGASVAPDVGFILQVAVHPDYQRRGAGEVLIYGLREAFLQEGLSRIALGVTLDNPARELYLRLGFEPLHSIDTYAWWEDFDQTLQGA